MKYGESTFDILYLLFAIAAGIFMLLRSRSKTGRMMGLAALILGSGGGLKKVYLRGRGSVLSFFALKMSPAGRPEDLFSLIE